MGTFFVEALLAAGDLDVLGADTLEGFGLAVDPVQRKLIPALQFGAANGH